MPLTAWWNGWNPWEKGLASRTAHLPRACKICQNHCMDRWKCFLPVWKNTAKPLIYITCINCTLVGNKHVNHLDVVGSSPVCAAPTSYKMLMSDLMNPFRNAGLCNVEASYATVECGGGGLALSFEIMHQATNHYLSQCWPRFKSSYGCTRPQWVVLRPEYSGRIAVFLNGFHATSAKLYWYTSNANNFDKFYVWHLNSTSDKADVISGRLELCQYHGCWCTGPFGSQFINGHVIDCIV